MKICEYIDKAQREKPFYYINNEGYYFHDDSISNMCKIYTLNFISFIRILKKNNVIFDKRFMETHFYFKEKEEAEKVMEWIESAKLINKLIQ